MTLVVLMGRSTLWGHCMRRSVSATLALLAWASLACLASIEIISPLAQRAAARLRELGYKNVDVKAGDGYLGWPERAPFDGIVVSAGARRVPPPLAPR